MRTIKIYGALAKFLKRRSFTAEVANAAEAVRFLVANFPGVEKFIAERHFRVSLGQRDLDIDEIHDPAGSQIIKITPVIQGAGKVFKIIAGIALIAIGVITGFTPLIGVGATLALGGVAELLSPASRIPTGKDTNNDPRKSYSFSGIQNTGRLGTPLNIVYGKMLTGSLVLSQSIDVAQVAV